MTREQIILLITQLRDNATKVADEGNAALAVELRGFAQALEDDLRDLSAPDAKKP
jgi:hypothetical protein